MIVLVVVAFAVVIGYFNAVIELCLALNRAGRMFPMLIPVVLLLAIALVMVSPALVVVAGIIGLGIYFKNNTGPSGRSRR